MTITTNTRITIGAVVAIGGVLWGAAAFVGRINQSMRELSAGLDTVRADRYTLSAASENALRMAIENPGTRVPDPRDPAKVFVVDIGRRTGEPTKP